MYTFENGRVMVTTSTGARVQCKGVFAMLMQAGSTIPSPDEPLPPTYEIVGLGGETQHAHHTADSIKERSTPEEKEQWEQYLKAHAEYAAQKAARDMAVARLRTNVLVDRGIVVLDTPDLDRWAERVSERYGIAVHDDPEDRWLQYINMEIAPTQDDMYALTAGIAAASGLSTEVMARVEDMFRHSMGQRNREAAAQDPAAVSGANAEKSPGMVHG